MILFPCRIQFCLVVQIISTGLITQLKMVNRIIHLLTLSSFFTELPKILQLGVGFHFFILMKKLQAVTAFILTPKSNQVQKVVPNPDKYFFILVNTHKKSSYLQLWVKRFGGGVAQVWLRYSSNVARDGPLTVCVDMNCRKATRMCLRRCGAWLQWTRFLVVLRHLFSKAKLRQPLQQTVRVSFEKSRVLQHTELRMMHVRKRG